MRFFRLSVAVLSCVGGAAAALASEVHASTKIEREKAYVQLVVFCFCTF
jgi:hypothetical protein